MVSVIQIYTQALNDFILPFQGAWILDTLLAQMLIRLRASHWHSISASVTGLPFLLQGSHCSRRVVLDEKVGRLKV